MITVAKIHFFVKEPYKEVEINLKITFIPELLKVLWIRNGGVIRGGYKLGTDYADYTDLWRNC